MTYGREKKRIVAWILAIVMVTTCVLQIPVRAGGETAIYTEDFEAQSGYPSDWAAIQNQNNAIVSVEKNNGNQVMIVEQKETNSANPTMYKMLGTDYRKAVLSYSVAARDLSGSLNLPTLYAGSSTIIKLCLNGGNIQYQGKNDAGWVTIMPLEAMKWYTFKLVYDYETMNASIYINGELKADAAQRTDGLINRIGMSVYSKTVNKYYIDNLKLTAEDHAVSIPPALHAEPDSPEPEETSEHESTEPEETSKPEETTTEAPQEPEDLLYRQDFENTVSGWVHANAGNTVVSVKENNHNKVLYFDQTADNGSAAANPSYYYNLSAGQDKVVFSYSVASAQAGGVFYLPTICANGTRLIELAFNQNSGNISVFS